MKRSSDELIDELLVLRSQNGDRSAWRQLVNRWQPRLYALARRLTSHAEGAADVTQETWIAIMRAIPNLEDASRFRPWAHRIVANKSTDWVRRRQRERNALHTAADELQSETTHRRQDEQAEAISKLQASINTLPQQHRHLLTMFYVEKMSLAEIAEVLDIPIGTVKSRLHSIRKELKMTFEGIQT